MKIKISRLFAISYPLFAAGLLIAMFAFQSGRAADDEPINENPVTLKVHLEPASVAAGDQALVEINLNVAPKHHAYRDMMKLVWTGEPGVTVDPLRVEPVHVFMDKFSKKQREGVEVEGTAKAMLHFPANFALGRHQGKVNFTYQACSERYCLFPKTVGLEFPITIIAGVDGVNPPAGKRVSNGGSASSAGAVTGEASGEFQKALAKGAGWAFLFVFIAGFLTSLTPCIFPMIPITISIIGARAVQNERSKAFGLSVTYVLGIATTYSLLGVLAASTGAFFGAALSNPYVVSVIAFIFIAMGLSMLGFYDIQVPLAIRNKFGSASTGTGVPGAYFAGLFAGIVASPCIGPVLVSILTYVAQTAQVVFGFFLLFSFAMGMGILFIVLGTFSGLLTKIPRAGPWMDFVKFTFGFTFVAMAFFYLFPVLPRPVFWMMLALMLFFLTSYYGAWTPTPATGREQLKKGMMLAGFFLGVCLMASVVFNAMGGLPGTTTSAGADAKIATNQMQWQPLRERTMASIGQNHRPTIVDFYADWCVACHELEGRTYNVDAVIEQSRAFDLIKVDATTNTPEIEKLQKEYRVVGLPTVLFIDSNGKVRDDLTVTGFVSADDFLRRMKKAQ